MITLALIALNALVFVAELGLTGRMQEALVLAGGAIPYEITHLVDLPPVRALVPPPLTIFTAMFLHGGFLHVLGNMWFLWLFGDNVEDRIGRVRYVAFYLLTGIVAALAQSLMMPGSRIPMIGASGAVAGVLGGYVVLFPRARVRTLVMIPLLWPVLELPAYVFLGLWFVGQFFIGQGSGIAWMAHVGGFLGGLGLVRLVAPRGRPAVVDVEYLPPRRR